MAQKLCFSTAKTEGNTLDSEQTAHRILAENLEVSNEKQEQNQPITCELDASGETVENIS